ncbi:MAG: hypothetical protein HYY17_01145 [Planctomycetes bacterium]|nr:hypothetical protein [Planctomycetota bacterium]
MILHGIHEDPTLDVEFMFGSRSEAERVTRCPEPDWKRLDPPTQMKPAERRALMAMDGDDILGKRRTGARPGDFRCGDYIFAYEKGAHRFLKKEPAAGGGDSSGGRAASPRE